MRSARSRRDRRARRPLALSATVLATALAAVGCQANSSATPGQAKTVKGMKVAYLAPSLDISYWQWVYSGVQQEARKHGLKVTRYNANNSPSAQLANVKTAIAAGADMIVIGPVSSTSTPPVLAAAKAAKVPISFAGIGPQPGATDYTSAITANNYRTGVDEGSFVCRQAKKRGGNKIGMLSLPQDRENAQKYLRGARESFKRDGCKLVQILQSHSLTVSEAVSQTNDLLTAHPDITGIYGMYDAAGTGAAKVLKTRGSVGKIALATADGSPTTVALLKEGAIQGLFLQEAVGQGIEGVIQDVNAMLGKPVKKSIPLNEPLVTTGTLTSPEAQKVLQRTYPPSAGPYN
ncbi:substrate-binding domain-containing protein [Streptomyces sp. NPDC002144]|uniref:substrate-binding domain-containing protein n=1 Tax=Streptomyces sp. NPDC001351 TaxID=3364564 RepID=UPI0036A6AEF0